jgi:hypothetical protein
VQAKRVLRGHVLPWRFRQESRPPYGMNNGLSISLLPKERRQLQDRRPNAPDERDANDQPGDEKVHDVTL